MKVDLSPQSTLLYTSLFEDEELLACTTNFESKNLDESVIFLEEKKSDKSFIILDPEPPYIIKEILQPATKRAKPAAPTNRLPAVSHPTYSTWWKKWYAQRRQYLENKKKLAESIANNVLPKSEIDTKVKENWRKEGLLGVRKRISAKDRNIAKKQLAKNIADQMNDNAINLHKQFSKKPLF
mgnify:CR=1 FL=1